MASLWKKPTSKYLYCCFTDATGTQRKRSTRTTDRAKARLICQAWEDVESAGRKGYLTTDEQFRRVFNDAFQRITGKKPYDPTVREWLAQWLETEKGAISEATFERYQQVVRDFLAFLNSRSELRLESLTTQDFLGFKDSLLAGGRSPQTVNLVIRKVLKRPFAIAMAEGIILHNPVARVRSLRGVKAEKGVFSPEQIVRLLGAAQDDWRGLILAGYFTGARLGDLVRLCWESVDLVERSITFTQKKTSARIKVPIHEELFEYLLSLKAPHDGAKPLFPHLHSVPGTGRKGLSMAFKRIMAAAGIADGTARERPGQAGRRISRLSFHSLRHSFTSALANAGVPAELRQKLTGHKSLEVHGIYTHTEFETLRMSLEAIARLPREGA